MVGVMLLGLGMCLAVAQPTAGALPSIEPTARAEIAELLAEARDTEYSADALAKLREAESRINAERSEIPPIPLKYLEADIARTRGNILYRRSRLSMEDTAPLDEAREQFERALEHFEQVETLGAETMEAIEAKRGKDVSRHRGWNEAQEYRVRSRYTAAWVRYQLGQCASDPVERKLHFDQAIDGFSEFVDMGYFRQPIIVESYLGTALCLLEMERYRDVIELLEEAERAKTPPHLYKPIMLARIRAWHALGDEARVIEAVDDTLGRLDPDDDWTSTDIELLIHQASAYARSTASPRDERQRAARRERLIGILDTLYARGDPARSQLLRTLGENDLDVPVALLADAYAHQEQNDLSEALKSAWRGLTLVETVTDPELRKTMHADHLHLLVALHWKAGEWAEVHELSCAFIGQYPRDFRAADVCVRGIHAGLLAMEQEPPLEEETFFDCLAVAKREFPDLMEAQKGEWYRAARLLADGRYLEVIEQLIDVPPESPAYRESLYGVIYASVLLAEQGANPATSRPADEIGKHLERARESLNTYVALTTKRPPPAGDELSARVVAAAVVLARQLLNRDDAEAVSVLAVLDAIETLPDITHESLDARLALRIEAHMARGDTEAATRVVDEALKKFASGAAMIRAMTAAASPLEERLDQLAENREHDRAALVARQLVRLYEHLLSEAQQRGADSKQTLALRQRLAGAYRQAGEHAKAIELYSRLAESGDPRQLGNVLRGLALSHEGARSYEQAIPLWRRLSKALPARTEGWYEARYHLIRSYQLLGRRDHARKLIQLFLLQNTETLEPPWRERFERLDRELQ